MRALAYLLLVMCVLSGAACDPSVSEPAEIAVISMGDGEAVLTETLRIDGYAEELTAVSYVAVGWDGTIAVDQRADQAIRFYTDDGELLGTFGREGQGPGEFTAMSRMGWIGDTLWVDDFDQARVTLISRDLALVRTISLPAGATLRSAFSDPPWPFVDPYGFPSDEEFLASLRYNVGVPDELRRTRTIARLRFDGTVTSIIAAVPTGQSSILIPGGSVAPPFPNASIEAVSPDGDMVAFVLATLDGPHAETIEVAAWNARGDTLFANRYPFAGEVIPAAVADSVLEARLSRLQGRAPSNIVTAFQQNASVPPIYPPVTGLLVGMDHSVWIEMRATVGARSYAVLNSDGSPLGTARLPEHSRIAAAREDSIWVIERDALGVHSIVRYEVTWAPQGEAQ